MEFHLLPEWAPQSAILLIWPHPYSDWAHNLSAIEPVYTDIVYSVTQNQMVLLVCFDKDHYQHVEQLLLKTRINLQRIRFVIEKTNDTWCRDYGPLSLSNNKKIKLYDYQFNGWGQKFNAELDNQLTTKLYQNNIFTNFELVVMDLVLEGGSIDSNGQDILLTTSQCLLENTRNPDLNQQQITNILKKQLGVSKIIWIENSQLLGDDSDGHIDMLVRFCNENTIAYSCCSNKNDANYHTLRELETELKALFNRKNSHTELVPLPIPEPVFDDSGRQLPASYANFLIINNAVLLPLYNNKNDSTAIKNLQQCFPGRKIIPVNCLPLIEQNGSLHCASMQLPQGLNLSLTR